MGLGIIDVREWQTTFDLRTGKKVAIDSDLIRMVKGLICRHPYPGDLELKSNTWVTDVALDLLGQYQPQFAFLSYAQPYFVQRFRNASSTEREEIFASVFAEIERFVKESGFVPVVVGSGDMIPLKGYTDLSPLDGLATTSNWSTRYAGIYGATASDLAYIKGLPHNKGIVSREEFMREFEGKPGMEKRLPDYLLVAEKGYAFKASGFSLRKLANIPAPNEAIPVHSTLQEPQSITDIRRIVEKALERQRVALIIVEGAGNADFRLPHVMCLNGKNWYTYEPGEAQYLAVTTGEHQYFNYPPGYRYYIDDHEKREYPFSGYFSGLPANTIGSHFAGRSIAVGNRSMFMHVTSGADISIECYARLLYNHGVMAVIHPERAKLPHTA